MDMWRDGGLDSMMRVMRMLLIRFDQHVWLMLLYLVFELVWVKALLLGSYKLLGSKKLVKANQ